MKLSNKQQTILEISIPLVVIVVLILIDTLPGAMINYGGFSFTEICNANDYYSDQTYGEKFPLKEYDYPERDKEYIVYTSPVLIDRKFIEDMDVTYQYLVVKTQRKFAFCSVGTGFEGIDDKTFKDITQLSMSSELLGNIAKTVYWKNKYDKAKTIAEMKTLEFLDISRIQFLDKKPFIIIK